MTKDFPCICGHPKNIHDPTTWKKKMFLNSEYLQDACYFGANATGSSICLCEEFTPHNLKYLESKYEEITK